MESLFAVRDTTPDEQDRVSTVALQQKSVSSVLRYATPLPFNRTPISTVGGPFPPFCGTPDPLLMNRIPFRTSPVEHKAVSSVLRYARPRFHRLFRPSPPDEHDDVFRSDPAGWLAMNTTTTLFLRSDPAMYTSPAVHMREYAFETLPVCTYVAVFSFLHSSRCTYVYMLRARLY